MKPPFERVVAEHGRTVLRVCRVVVGVDDADDAWSETFLAAMRAYPALPADANVEAWLVTIAHRKALDIVRGQRRHAILLEELPETASLNGVSGTGVSGTGVAGIGAPGSGDGELWDAVKALPLKQRQAVTYHYVAGLPYRDIAAILGGTTDAVRRAASDGIKTLRTAFPGAHAKGSTHQHNE